MAVNADLLVQIVPRVMGAGTSGLKFSGLFLTKSKLPPADRVLSFSSAEGVGAYFGTDSDEYRAAVVYFGGYTNTQYLPSTLYIAPWRSAAAAAWLRGAAYEGALADLQDITDGSLTLEIDGQEAAVTGIDLSSATSFSDVANKIQTALAAVEALTTDPVVSFSSQTNAFQVTSGTTGAGSSVSFASASSTGTDLATVLHLTEQEGAVQSVGTDGSSLTDCMTNILRYARDWVSFSSIFEPEHDEKIELAQWCASHDTRFAYVMWDTDNAARVAGSTASAGYEIKHTLELSGTIPVWNTLQLAAAVMGAIACINFQQYNGRLTLAYKQFEGVEITCDNDQDYNALIDNGYNCYADFATASTNLKFFQTGQVTGEFIWAESYLNAIGLKDQLQLNILDLFAASRSIPYNEDGYSQIRTACLDTINRFREFGAFRDGVVLSNTQKVQLLQELGTDVSQTLTTQGWYMQISDPGPTVRAQRGTPNCYFYYTDGGSIQRVIMSATCIQ